MTLYTHRHVKRGTRYVVVGEARAQCSTVPIQDGDMLTLYRGEDGVYGVRPPVEFNDGRFVEIFEEDGVPTMEQLRTQVHLLELSQSALLNKLKRVRAVSRSRLMRLRKNGRLT